VLPRSVVKQPRASDATMALEVVFAMCLEDVGMSDFQALHLVARVEDTG
jgi:hypothetical protein